MDFLLGMLVGAILVAVGLVIWAVLTLDDGYEERLREKERKYRSITGI